MFTRLRHSISRSGRISWPIALTLMALIIAAVVLIVFLRLETWPARTAQQSTAGLERLGKDLRAAFIDIAHLQPRITINNRVYMEQTMPVSELIVLSRRIEVEHELLHTWVGSSKRVKLHGTFNVKAGFDLRQNLSIDIRPNEIIVQLHPRRFWVSRKSRWTSSRLKMGSGTESPERMCKTNCPFCLSSPGKKLWRAVCLPKPNARCSDNSTNAFTRGSRCIWFSPTRRKVNSDERMVKRV